MTPPDRPETPMSNVDDPEWIKGLVAKALLQAADEGTDSSTMAPTPVVPPRPQWPELAPLDTSSFARARDAAITPTVSDTTESTVSETTVSDTTQMPAISRPEPVPAPATPPVSDTTKTSVSDTVHSAEVAPSFRAAPSPETMRASTPTSVLEAIAEDRTDFHDDTLEDHDDAVMVEATAVTEGFRSSDIRTVVEWLLVIVSALVVALIIKALVLQAFWIPSESMETTVNKGDRILVNKVSYHLHDVRRGDLVVFEKLEGTPGDTKDLIKRAIALPGETIEIRSDGRIWIWGPGETPADAKLLEEPYLDPQNAVLNAPSASDPLTADVWDERCTNQPRTPGRCTLDDSSYFMMGDNRTRSSDSRFFGPIPDENIVGRAFLRIWPLGDFGTL